MNKNIIRLLAISLIAVVSACSSNPSNNSSEANSSSLDTSSSLVGSNSSTSNGNQSHPMRDNELYTDSLSITFNAKGARIQSVKWKGTEIGKDGFIVGRCANRIDGAKFTLNGETYNLTRFSDGSSLHGGGSGGNWQGPFANATWEKVGQTADTITYKLESKDGDNGYPGNMTMTVKYTLDESGKLDIEYTATTDKDTLCNPTNHLFMNLNGNTSYSNLKLWIDADSYTPLKSNQIPTGDITSVEGTKFDYRIEQNFRSSESYDDNLVLNGSGYRKVATMTGTTLGVKVDVYTDRPGLQLYKENSGRICLETQMFPDAINQPDFEDPILRAGETFYSKTAYCFSKLS